jgi:hypothetical protein
VRRECGKLKELDWFITTVECEFKVQADREEVSYEGIQLYRHEIDESLIPSDMLLNLPESLLFETLVFDSPNGTEWLGIVAMDVESKEWYLQVILKDGEPVLQKRIKGE